MEALIALIQTPEFYVPALALVLMLAGAVAKETNNPFDNQVVDWLANAVKKKE